MASCDVFPTLTTAQVSNSQSLVTTSTQFVSTAPGSVSTVVVSTCAQVGSSASCLPTVTTSFITSPGSTTTVIVPTTLTVNVPVTVLTTLFGSSCSSRSSRSISSSTTSTFSTPTFTPTSTSTPSFSASPTSTDTTTSSTISVVTTPSPSVIITSSLVTSDGSVFLSSFTSMSTPSPVTTVLALSTVSPTNKRIAAGPVVGGVVGGMAVLLLLGLLTWRLVKKQSKFDRFFNRNGSHDDFHHGPHHRGSLLEKPSYQYGMVGQQTSIPVSLEPQHSLPAVQNAFGNSSGTGQAQGLPQSAAGQAVIGNDGGLGQASGQVSGQVSGPLGNGGGLGQASGPPGALGTNGGLGQTAAGASHGVIGNMPPITHTGDPSLIPLIAGTGTTGLKSTAVSARASGLHAPATSSRPSSSRPSSGSSSQVLGPLVTPAKPQGGYLPTLQNWSASRLYDQPHAGPSNPPINNNGTTEPLISCSASTSSEYSHESWTEDPSTNNSGSIPPVLPSMDPSLHQQQYQQHHRRTSNGRVVSNNTQADYEYQPYADAGSSSRGRASSSQEAPLYDEQRRPLNVPPEKGTLVHLDGALYQEPSGEDARSGHEPPAYIE